MAFGYVGNLDDPFMGERGGTLGEMLHNPGVGPVVSATQQAMLPAPAVTYANPGGAPTMAGATAAEALTAPRPEQAPAAPEATSGMSLGTLMSIVSPLLQAGQRMPTSINAPQNDIDALVGGF